MDMTKCGLNGYDCGIFSLEVPIHKYTQSIFMSDSVMWLLYSYVSIRSCKNICGCGLISGIII